MAFQAIGERMAERQRQQSALVQEACQALLHVPDGELQECRVERDLSSVVWEKKSEQPAIVSTVG